MTLTRRAMLGTAAVAALPRLGRAQATPTIKLGVLNDMSGPYRDDGGPNGVICCKQALIDFGVPGKGFNVEVIFADHQNKPDVGAGIARQWLDRDGVDAIVDVPTSSVGLAVNEVCREKNKVMLNSGTGTSDLTGKQCSPNTIHWTYDTYMLAQVHRRRDREAGRRHLVLHHRRLRVRPDPGARYRRAGDRRPAARCWAT